MTKFTIETSAMLQNPHAILETDESALMRQMSKMVVGGEQELTTPPITMEHIKRTMEYCLRSNKIGCIKITRELTGLGLKEAKEFVDNIWPVNTAVTVTPPLPPIVW